MVTDLEALRVGPDELLVLKLPPLYDAGEVQAMRASIADSPLWAGRVLLVHAHVEALVVAAAEAEQ